MSVIRFQLGRDNEYLNRHIEYIRSRIRIARASTINFALVTLFVALFIQLRLQQMSPAERWPLFAFELILGIVLVVIATYSWYKLTGGYYYLVKVNSNFLQTKQKDEHTKKVTHKLRKTTNKDGTQG
jgi:uncharacterized protein YacL